MFFGVEPILAANCYKFVSPIVNKDLAESLQYKLSKKGICINVDYFPGKRATKDFESGQYVGEIGRIRSYADYLGESGVLIGPRISSSIGVLISDHLKNKEDLLNYKGTLGLLHGWKWMEDIANKMRVEKLFKAKSVYQLVQSYDRKRVSSFLVSQGGLKSFRISRNYKMIKVFDIELFVWLHKSHLKQRQVIESALYDIYQ
ncbi:hypothetical protein [Halobacteriovorax sp. JY17]|uniref:hypothetical protein n=1 Tax=Halobacteriovorax sp. JY17 TaxID=2014617 RepID=UPI000C6BE7D9|nr:hypothetical protein [Halobacteriovorax sp. JY17]PIK16084.1 MAG: hypothetical protein CES88_04960 [Halobacteriovorax sp. JY17]